MMMIFSTKYRLCQGRIENMKNAKERSDFICSGGIFFFLFWEKEIISKTRIIILSHSFNKRKSKIILKWNDEISATEK